MPSPLSIEYVPGYNWTVGEILTAAKLNLAANPTISLIGTISTSTIGDGSVTTAKLADSAVTALKLASDAVTTVKILDDAVTEAKLATTIDFTGHTITLPAATIAAILSDAAAIQAAGYASANTALPAAGATTELTHTLGVVPAVVRLVLVCVTNDANSGYVTTDGEIDVTAGTSIDNQPLLFFRTNSTNKLEVQRNSDATMRLPHKTTGLSTVVSAAANFNFKIYARP